MEAHRRLLPSEPPISGTAPSVPRYRSEADNNGIAADQIEWYLDKETGKTLARLSFSGCSGTSFTAR